LYQRSIVARFAPGTFEIQEELIGARKEDEKEAEKKKKYRKKGSKKEVKKEILKQSGRLCGLVVRVPGYGSRDPGSIPCATRFF
jgi:hypothetical protein